MASKELLFQIMQVSEFTNKITEAIFIIKNYTLHYSFTLVYFLKNLIWQLHVHVNLI